MVLRSQVWSAVTLLGLSAIPSPAPASDLIVGNLDQPPSPSSPVQINTKDFWAQEFTTGGLTVNLASIIANLGNLVPGANGDFALTARLI
jgi:hypothetical protein